MGAAAANLRAQEMSGATDDASSCPDLEEASGEDANGIPGGNGCCSTTAGKIGGGSKSKSRQRSSSLRDNPFEVREGKCLTWTNVNMTVSPKRSSDEPKRILSNVWGEVPPKQLTAIAGPSGAGKTSLLNILSGRAKSHGRLKVDADIRLNKYEVKPTRMKVRRQIAFVAQDDSLPITATPRECIRFSAKLRLPRSTEEGELDRLVDRMLDELGLSKCADTIVGGPLLKGVSGGERKRTSVGVELVVKPAIVMLDEPTSGLDSFSAVQLLQVLKKVSNSGASVLFTIHQPSSEIFASFDQFILLNMGRVMYQGHVDDLPNYFASRGHAVPQHYNPADFAMNVAQTYTKVELEDMGFFPLDTRNLPGAIHRSSSVCLRKRSRSSSLLAYAIGGAAGEVDQRQPSILTEIRLLFVREVRGIKRYKRPVVGRILFSSFMSLLVGVIFFGVGGTDPSIPKNIQSHFGAIMIVLMQSMFGTAMPSLLQFPTERPVFLREYSTDHYSVVSYFVSRLTMEASITLVQVFVNGSITFNMVNIQMHFLLYVAVIFSLAMTSTAAAVMLGSIVENPKMALELLPVLFVPQFLFAGFFVASDLIPPVIRWAQYLCSMTYAIQLGLLYEFGDCDALTCQGLLESNGVSEEDSWWYWLVLVSLFLGFRLAALGFLRKKATKFL